jgi:nucleotide-binding universal stress UspA family protein
MKLLVATGGADLDDVEADLQRAGLPPDTQALVLSVADVIPIPALPEEPVAPAAVRRARERDAEVVAEAERTAASAAARLADTFPGWKIDAATEADAPTWAIVRRAEEWKADLIVVGSRNRSTLARILLGSVAESVVWHARTSVRIARRPRAPGGAPPRVIVATDGSTWASRAVAAVAGRTWPRGTQVRLVAVMDSTLAALLRPRDVEADEEAAIRRVLEEAAAKLRAGGLETSTALLHGDPRHALLEEAERDAADCLFVGVQGLRAVGRFLLGSVSAAVAARAACSVEVVRG